MPHVFSREIRSVLNGFGSSRTDVPRSVLPCTQQEAMKEADADGSGSVSFGELASLMHKLKKDPNSSSAFVRKIHKAPAAVSHNPGLEVLRG